jgi:hypothetical protein
MFNLENEAQERKPMINATIKPMKATMNCGGAASVNTTSLVM